MKYIDAEKLKEEIERLKSVLTDTLCSQGNILGPDWVAGGNKMLKEISSAIDSLQQDQDLIIINKKDWEAQEQFRKNKHFGKPLQQEQPEVDLNFQVFAKEMDAVFNLPKEVTENTEENPLNWEYAIALHFYELGLNASKEE